MIISRTPQRKVDIDIEGEGDGYYITEKTSYVPLGYQRARWNSNIVYLSGDDMDRLIKAVNESKKKERPK